MFSYNEVLGEIQILTGFDQVTPVMGARTGFIVPQHFQTIATVCRSRVEVIGTTGESCREQNRSFSH